MQPLLIGSLLIHLAPCRASAAAEAILSDKESSHDCRRNTTPLGVLGRPVARMEPLWISHAIGEGDRVTRQITTPYTDQAAMTTGGPPGVHRPVGGWTSYAVTMPSGWVMTGE